MDELEDEKEYGSERVEDEEEKTGGESRRLGRSPPHSLPHVSATQYGFSTVADAFHFCKPVYHLVESIFPTRGDGY